MEYNRLSDYLIRTFGTKVYKLSLQSGCTCPNRDGTLGTGGCTFCSAGGSGEFAAPLLPLREQIRIAKEQIAPKIPSRILPADRRYIAYFQSFTNTYADPDRLFRLYDEALSHPEIVVLSIGTRPDCLAPPMIEMLSRLRALHQKPVWVELGLQTIHKKTELAIHRGYPLSVFTDAYIRLKQAGLGVIIHLIFGFPQETRDEMLDSVRYISSLNPAPDGIKLQLLQILRGSMLAEQYEACPFPLMSLEEYCSIIIDSLKLLPPETVVHRLTGDGPKRLLIAPLWCADKKRVMNTLQKRIQEA